MKIYYFFLSLLIIVSFFSCRKDNEFLNREIANTQLNKDSLTLALGGREKLFVETENFNSIYKWSSSDSKVATIDNDGVVSTKAEGVATISVQVGEDKTLKCELKVLKTSKTKQMP